MAYDIQEARERVIQAGLELQNTGLIARTWGNISARISDTQFVITPSGRGYDTLTPDQIVVVNIEDCSYEGDIKPSSEKGVHAAGYRNRPDVNFVIHTHQQYATDLSILGRDVQVADVDLEAVSSLGPVIPVAGYGMFSTPQLTGNVEEQLTLHPDCTTILMSNHGTLVLGKDYEDAFEIAHTLEKVSENLVERLAGDLLPEDLHTYKTLMEYCELHGLEENDGNGPWAPILSKDGFRAVMVSRTPFTRKVSTFGKPIVAYVDDFAQMLAEGIPCLPADATIEQIAASLSGTYGAVLVQEKGAVCAAGDPDDAQALMMVLEKNCQSALLHLAGADPRPLPKDVIMEEHDVYMNHYAKLKKQVLPKSKYAQN